MTPAERAAASGGTSGAAIYAAVRTALAGRHPGGGRLLDVGCGHGNLWPVLKDRFDRYAGADAVRYPGLPADAEFHLLDLDAGRVPLPDGSADVVAAVETIEHLENPRAFARELTRLCRPGGWVVVSTPNQLSLLSKLCLVVKNRFSAFSDRDYPAHLTALLEQDLRRIAAECRLDRAAVVYTAAGRIPGTARRYPSALSRRFPRALSDNVVLVARRPPVC